MKHSFTEYGGCFECGNDVLFQTDATQPSDEGWKAYDGDEGRCVECNQLHQIHIDDSGEDACAWVDVSEEAS